jgi:hypothetical protein
MLRTWLSSEVCVQPCSRMAVITMPGPLAVFIGDNEPNVSWGGLQNFCVMAVELISRTAAAPRTCDGGGCPQGSPEREAGKQAFTDLMRGNMWIVTIACALYVAFVFVGPRLISKPLPVMPVLQVWNLALAIFSFTGSFHCAGALLGNVRTFTPPHIYQRDSRVVFAAGAAEGTRFSLYGMSAAQEDRYAGLRFGHLGELFRSQQGRRVP